MFCGKCGNQVADGSAVCPNCGAQIGAPQPVQAQPVQAQPVQQQPVQQQPNIYQQAPNTYTTVPVGENPAYKTMGGWLLVFMICYIIGIIYSIYEVIDVNSQWGEVSGYAALAGMSSYNTFFMVWSVIIVALAVMQAVYVYFVFSKNEIFLKYYQIFSIINIVLSLIIIIYAGTLPYSNSFAGELTGSEIGGIIGGVVGLILMTMYYCKSVRVRTYMGSTTYMDNALFKIGV